MTTSLSWIKAYVPELEVEPQEYMDAMTLSGSKVEGYKKLDEDLEKIVIGQVLKIEKHPDADKLVICQVDIGGETTQIVTGAPNVFEGAKVPVVLDGGRVAGGHDGKVVEGGIKIKKGKLRGIESNGMMCSIEELGSTTDMYPDAAEDGLYILPEDAPVGESAVTYLGLDDVVVEYEITSNRVDCFSILGIAREAAATFHKEFKPPVVTATGNSEDVHDYIKVSVEDADLCPRYTARVVKNIKIAPSPKWMQHRLASHGIRPINNIVDITNYVMEEFGQPMHAYDMDTISGHEIRVRRAAKGEKFVTLDGQERTLDDSILMICDGEKAIGLAGIMGGENSMITDNVQTMLFEAACFDGTNIRLSSKKVGLRTDASSKFEKGLDPNNAIEAMNRACQLIEELGAGEVVGGVVDVYQKEMTGRRIAFDPDWINGLLGTDISAETMIGYFKKIDLGFDEETQEVIVPSWRQDLLRDADIAEEVARFYGYDNIPTTLLSQVDSSIGGKTAIDFGGVKNIVGAFYQPKKVIIDPEVLETLSRRQLMAGLAEAIKMAATNDAELFELIENSADLTADLPQIIYRALMIKKSVVEQDPRETGLRKVLNFGHTIGHAVESFSAGKLLHGECVALGMIPMSGDNAAARIKSVLEKYGLPSKIGQSAEELMPFLKHDKKMASDGIAAVIVDEIGSFRLCRMSADEILSRLEG